MHICLENPEHGFLSQCFLKQSRHCTHIHIHTHIYIYIYIYIFIYLFGARER